MNLHILRSREMALISDFLHDLYAPVAAGEFGGHVVNICTRHFRDYVNTIIFDQTARSSGDYTAESNRMEELQPHFPALGAYIHQNPSWAYAAGGGIEKVLMITDFITQRQWRRTDLYHGCFKQMNMPHQIAVSLPGPTHICGLVLNHDRPIHESLRPILQILAPHIERAHALAQSRGVTPAALHANDLTALGLTVREAEILLWIAEGKRDAEIATILGIASRTVSKHVERILAKLGAETRGAAAAAAQQRPWKKDHP